MNAARWITTFYVSISITGHYWCRGHRTPYLGSPLRICGVGCSQGLMATPWSSSLPLRLLMALSECLRNPNWSLSFCPVPGWVDFVSLAACLCLAKAGRKHAQCRFPPSSLVNFRTSNDTLCFSLLFSIPDTYTNVFDTHFLCLGIALGSPNGDLVVLCFLVYIA